MLTCSFRKSQHNAHGNSSFGWVELDMILFFLISIFSEILARMALYFRTERVPLNMLEVLGYTGNFFFEAPEILSTSFQCSVCLGRGKAVICGEKIRFFPFFTLGSYFRGTKMVLISAEPFFRFVHFYAWFLFSREQNGSYFRAHIKNAKI